MSLNKLAKAVDRLWQRTQKLCQKWQKAKKNWAVLFQTQQVKQATKRSGNDVSDSEKQHLIFQWPSLYWGSLSQLQPWLSAGENSRFSSLFTAEDVSRNVPRGVACENIRFSSLFAAGDVSRETSPAEKSEEKRMFSQVTAAKSEEKRLAWVLNFACF